MYLPQGLCTRWSLCLECFSPAPAWLTLSPPQPSGPGPHVTTQRLSPTALFRISPLSYPQCSQAWTPSHCVQSPAHTDPGMCLHSAGRCAAAEKGPHGLTHIAVPSGFILTASPGLCCRFLVASSQGGLRTSHHRPDASPPAAPPLRLAPELPAMPLPRVMEEWAPPFPPSSLGSPNLIHQKWRR